MAWIWRLPLALTALFVAALVALYLFRAPLAEAAIERAARSAGFESADVKVAAIGPGGLRIRDARLGAADAPAVALDAIGARLDWSGGVFAPALDQISIGPGVVRVVVAADGTASLPGYRPPPSAGGGDGSAPAIGALTIEDLKIIVETPEGAVVGAASGALSSPLTEPAGELRLVADAAAAGLAGARIADARVDAVLSATPGGAVAARLSFTGDGSFGGYAVDGLDATVAARLPNVAALTAVRERRWADAAGEASLDVSAGDVVGLNAPLLTATPGIGAAPVERASVSGRARARLDRGAAAIRFVDGPFVVETGAGDRLEIASVADAPILETSSTTASARLAARLTGLVDAEATAEASGRDCGATRSFCTPTVWTVSVDGRTSPVEFPNASFDGASFALIGEATARDFRGEGVAEAALQRAVVSRLLIEDARARFEAPIRVDVAGRSVEIGSAGSASCVALEKARARIPSQALAASVGGASFCGGAGPLARASWGGAQTLKLDGTLKAKRGFLRLGETKLEGAPPSIDLRLDADVGGQVSTATAAYAGGDLRLNDALRFSKMAGDLVVRLDGPALGADVELDRARMDQASETPLAAPFIVAGTGALADEDFKFDFAVETPAGLEVGAGRGLHDVARGAGFAEFAAGPLVFNENSLALEDFSPAFVGIASKARGVAEGRFKFDWSADGVRSQGDLSLEDLTFRGPGLAVTQTAGINGDIRLTSLMPPTTDGVQRLRIDRIDLDALQLVEGAVDFALDGDDVLRIENASFPWFGGRIGVYDTEVAMKDGSATAVLRADEANLDEILEFVDVAGLSGEGVLDGVLPLVVEDGRARIDGGALSAVGPGVVRYVGAAAVAAASASADAALAFDGLQEFRYASLSATVDGPLDGDLKIGLEFEGEGAVRLNDPRLREATVLPMIYRVSVAGPLLQLVQQSKRTKNLILKLEGAVSSDEDGGP